MIVLGGISQARAQRQMFEAEAQIREAMADHHQLNALQAEYRDWVKQPRFVKYGGQWFAVVEYPPSIPRVKRK